MKTKHTLLFAFLFFISVKSSFAQVPTPQDCLGAIPICQNIYTTGNSYLGSGNYPGEICPGTCLTGEINSTWMTFTVQQSGNLNFTITPAISTDYDWTVYNLTGTTCAAILTNPALMVSCNSSAPFGATGTNAFSTLNFQGPGWGTAFNAPIPVLVGETYVINISNWFGTAGGFTIDFSASTAVIFDNIPPVLQSVNQPVNCNSTTLTFHFSENILCNTVQNADFTLTGPGGPYTLSGVTGAACAAGGTMENTFTITVSPAITQGGVYSFNLVGGSGFVTDLCGNVASASSIPFTINTITGNIISQTNPTCSFANGSFTIGGNGGTAPYTFSNNGGAFQASGTFSNLSAGNNSIIIQDANGCSGTMNVVLVSTGGGVVAAINNVVNVSCNGLCDGAANGFAVGGTAPFTYAWSSGANTQNANTLCAGNDTVLITDAAGCFDTAVVTITQPPLITGVPSHTDVLCFGGNSGTASIIGGGGTGSLNYLWTPSGGSNSSATNLTAGNYTVTITDANNCIASFPIVITQPALLVLNPSTPSTVCDGLAISFTASANGGTQPYSFNWNNNTFNGATFSASPNASTFYTCVVTDANGCVSQLVNFPVTVIPLPTVNLGSDVLLCDGETVLLDAYFPNAFYLWNDGSTQQTFTITKEGIYFVDVSNSCATATDSVSAIFHDCNTCGQFPNAFTPNGDGRNDEFLGLYDCAFGSFDMKIFNRWGELIFETNFPADGWDGTFNGVNCEMGTYIYVCTVTGTGVMNNSITETKKGNITLIR